MKFRILIPLIIISLVASGCISSKSMDQSSNTPAPTPVKSNPNLDAKIVSLTLDRDYYNAGEPVTAKLTIANTGTINITSEKVVVEATVVSLEDFLGNMYLKIMSKEEKSRSYTKEYNDKVLPESVKSFSATFRTMRETQGRNLAGQYIVTVSLYVNDQWADSREIQITLHSGTPVEPTPIVTPTPQVTEFIPTPTPTPTPTLIPTPTPMLTPTPTPTPTPIPTPVNTPEINVTPTGVNKEVRIMGGRFGIPTLSIKPGDAVFWNNFDDSTMIVDSVEDFPFANLTVASEGRSSIFVFNRSGTYHYELYNNYKRKTNSILTITVR